MKRNVDFSKVKADFPRAFKAFKEKFRMKRETIMPSGNLVIADVCIDTGDYCTPPSYEPMYVIWEMLFNFFDENDLYVSTKMLCHSNSKNSIVWKITDMECTNLQDSMNVDAQRFEGAFGKSWVFKPLNRTEALAYAFQMAFYLLEQKLS